MKSGAAHTSGSARAGVESVSAQGSMPDKGLGNKHGRLPSPAPWTHGVSTPTSTPIPIAVTLAANLLTSGLASKGLWELSSYHGLHP